MKPVYWEYIASNKGYMIHKSHLQHKLLGQTNQFHHLGAQVSFQCYMLRGKNGTNIVPRLEIGPGLGSLKGEEQRSGKPSCYF
jgi:hypothetical protein